MSVKEFWKSVKKWQSYDQEFAVFLFWDTVYIRSFIEIRSGDSGPQGVEIFTISHYFGYWLLQQLYYRTSRDKSTQGLMARRRIWSSKVDRRTLHTARHLAADEENTR